MKRENIFRGAVHFIFPAEGSAGKANVSPRPLPGVSAAAAVSGSVPSVSALCALCGEMFGSFKNA